MNTALLNFMAIRQLTALTSLLLVILSVISLSISGLNLGLDFTGGTLIELSYGAPAPLDLIRETLEKGGFEAAQVQSFGSSTEVLIRLAVSYRPGVGEEVQLLLQQATGLKITLLRTEFVGAQVGEDLRERGGLGVLTALGAIMLYVSLRFQIKFALAALMALFHDVLIVLGAFSLFRWEFDLTVLAAILAVIGYSLNDTLVVADRIRENIRCLRQGSMLEIVNRSLTETLSRTLMTSLTTMLVVLALFLFGGGMIHGFATALLIGISVGTYSSIYVASDLLLRLNVRREDLLPPAPSIEEDNRP